MAELYFMDWDEFERGWGRRPDGCSIHATEKDCEAFIALYWSKMPNETPDEYSSPSSSRPKKLACSEHEAALCKSGNGGLGARLWSGQYKVDGDRFAIRWTPELVERATKALSDEQARELRESIGQAGAGSRSNAPRI